jgi:isocitrate dehydrogenase
MSKSVVTLIPGDGVGPECIDSAVRILEAAGAQIEWERREAGAEVFKQGIASGVKPETIESIKRTRCALKGPLMTPVGFGEKSANVTLRKLFETYANIRPVREMAGVPTPYSGRGVDLVIVRENVEDLYAGIEHMQTPGVAQCLKLISRKGCEKIVRLGFEVARSEGCKTVHCATKGNIMKLTEGLLKRTFEEVAREYPDIQAQHIIVDNCAHQLVKKPEQFEVIITTNMNGDILSDLSSALVGGLGFAPSANLGSEVAIFEAVHGSAPKYAGKDSINPTAVILSAVAMLRHLGQFEAASKVEDAVLLTWEQAKARTRDVVGDAGAAGTRAYTDAVIANLGHKPTRFKSRAVKPLVMPKVAGEQAFVKPGSRAEAGVDIFIECAEDAAAAAAKLEKAAQGSPFRLKMIDSRGTMVYPATGSGIDLGDLLRARFMLREGAAPTDQALFALLAAVSASYRVPQMERLMLLDGKPAFTKAQGED